MANRYGVPRGITPPGLVWGRFYLGGREHLGYTLGRLADGRIPTYRGRGMALYEREFRPEVTGGEWAGPEDAETVNADPAAIVPACICGWRGEDIPYATPNDQYADDVDPFNSPEAEAPAWEAWHAHAEQVNRRVDPAVRSRHLERLGEVAAILGDLTDTRPRSALNVARLLRELADHIEPLAVAQARALDVPWDVIGTDLGVTRQAVNGRYTKPSRELQQRVADLTGGTVAELLTAVPQRDGASPPMERAGWTAAVHRILGADALTPAADDAEPL